MERDRMVWRDVAEVLEEYEGDQGDQLLDAKEDEAEEELNDRLERVSGVRERYEGAFGEGFCLYVPAPDFRASEAGRNFAGSLAPGTAIVGGPAGAPYDVGRVHVCYEGNLYGAVNLKTFDARASTAADRLKTGYPTVARALVEAGDLVAVGRVRPNPTGAGGSGYSVWPSADAGARRALAEWIGVPEEGLEAELSSAKGR